MLDVGTLTCLAVDLNNFWESEIAGSEIGAVAGSSVPDVGSDP